MDEFNIIPNEKRIFFLNSVPPCDTGIPLEHDYIFIKKVDTPNGISYHGGGTMSYTTFGIWGRGDEGDNILKCYTFDFIIMFSINIH